MGFNGKYQGTLDFQNFRFKIKGKNQPEEVFTVISGKIMIGQIDVTNRWRNKDEQEKGLDDIF